MRLPHSKISTRLAADRHLRRHPRPHRHDGGDGNGGACAMRHRRERRLPLAPDAREHLRPVRDGQAAPAADRADVPAGPGAGHDLHAPDGPDAVPGASLPDSERARFAAAAVRPRSEQRCSPRRRGRDGVVCGGKPAAARPSRRLAPVAAAARHAEAVVAVAAAEGSDAVRVHPAAVAPAGAGPRGASAGGRAATAALRSAAAGDAGRRAGARDAVRGRPCCASCPCAARTRGLFSP